MLPSILNLIHGILITLCVLYAIHFIAWPERAGVAVPSARQLRFFMAAMLILLVLGYIFDELVLLLSPDSMGDSFLTTEIRFLNLTQDILVVPFSVLILTNITHRRPLTTRICLWHLVPFAAVFLVNIVLFAVLPSPSGSSFPYVGTSSPSLLIILWPSLMVVATSIYAAIMLVLNLRAAVRYNQFIRQQYSDLYGRDLRWIFYLSGLFAFLLLSWLGYTVTSSLLIRIIYYSVTILIWDVLCRRVDIIISTRESFAAHAAQSDSPAPTFAPSPTSPSSDAQASLSSDAQASSSSVSPRSLPSPPIDSHLLPSPPSSQDIPAPSPSSQAIPSSPEDPAVQNFRLKLQTVCEAPRLYTNEDLTRDDLARAMLINHTYFTRLLRITTGLSFYEYINSLRMTYAEELLRDPSFPLDQISFEVGYKYKSTYYRAFKDKHNCTPSDYRSRVLAARSASPSPS